MSWIGVIGMGMAIPNGGRPSALALSLAALAAQTDDQRVLAWARIMREKIEATLRR